MDILFKTLCAISLALFSEVMAESVQKFKVSIDRIALHNNQFLVNSNGEWMCVGEVSPDGKNFVLSDAIQPSMGCSRFEVDVRYKDLEVVVIVERDPPEKENKQTESDPPNCPNHAEQNQNE